MKSIFRFFFQGLLYVTPITVTIYILYIIAVKLNDLASKIVPFDVPGLGIIILFIFITLIGVLGTVFITQPIRNQFNKYLTKAPLVKVIYTSIKDLLSAFVGKEKKFSNPVLVKVNNISNLEKVGFITQKDLSALGVKGDKVAVYFPHSYAFSGELFIVPVEYITPINKSSGEVIKFIISGGVSKD